jgi:hypothetical protein
MILGQRDDLEWKVNNIKCRDKRSDRIKEKY